MRRKLGHIFLFFLLSGMLYAQESALDSLIGLAEKNPGDKKASLLYEISSRIKFLHPDSALQYANQAELLLERSDPETLIPYVYKLKGSIYEIRDNYERSLFYYQKAYEGFIVLEEQTEVGECAEKIGDLHYDLADYADAYTYYLHSLNAYENEVDREGIAKMENSLGTVSHEMGDLDDAEQHYLRSYEIYHQRGDVVEECKALANIGLILYDKKLTDSALHYFNEVLDKINTESAQTEMELYILTGVYNNMALLYIDRGEHEQALRYLRLGLSLAKKMNDQFDIGTLFSNMGSLYGEIDMQDSALYFLHRALRIAKQFGFKHLELDVYDELSKLHARAGSYASAYNWLLRYDTVNKAVFNEMQSNRIAQLRARYEQELSERGIEQLQSDAQVQKMLNKAFIIFIVVIVGLVIVIAVNLRSKKRTNQMLAERNLQLSNTLQKLSESEKELQQLNMSKDRIFSVVAHDLRNPVAAVTGFSELLFDNFDQFSVETQKEYLLQVLQGTQRIQNLLENLLIWARSQMKAVKYKPEVVTIRTIVDECVKEMKANLDHKKIDCLITVDKKCKVFADKAMIHTVFRNLLMNAIKFSFPGGKVRIASENGSNSCNVAVSDEGIGIQPEIQKKLFDANEVVSSPGTTGESGSGLGLVICKEFLEKNQGTISVESEPGNGSTFVVSLPAATDRKPAPVKTEA